MSRSSNVSDLQARLQKRTEQERQQIEAMFQSQLSELSENLKRIVENELYIIGRDTKVLRKRLSVAVLKAWAGPIGVDLLIFLGICGGSWGLTRWYANQIQSLIETRAALEFEIQEARQTIERIEQTTWGVKLVEVNGQRFAILPESTPENPLLSMDGRPTVRLSSE